MINFLGFYIRDGEENFLDFFFFHLEIYEKLFFLSTLEEFLCFLFFINITVISFQCLMGILIIIVTSISICVLRVIVGRYLSALCRIRLCPHQS